jgi:hypothetical protein
VHFIVVRNIATSLNGTVLNRARQYIACADNMLVLGQTVTLTEEVVRQIREVAVSNGLVINESKTKHLKLNRNVTNLEQGLRCTDSS